MACVGSHATCMRLCAPGALEKWLLVPGGGGAGALDNCGGNSEGMNLQSGHHCPAYLSCDLPFLKPDYSPHPSDNPAETRTSYHSFIKSFHSSFVASVNAY